MGLVKRTLNGYRPPIVPRGPRSIRKRILHEKNIEGTQICAFELLATVAGKLLEESGCSSASSSAAVGFDKCGIKKESQDDQGSSEGSVYFSGNQKGICKEKAVPVTVDHVSPLSSSVCSEKVHPDSKLATPKNNDDIVKLLSSQIIQDFPLSGESDDTNIGNALDRRVDVNEGAMKSPLTTNCEEIVELPLCRDSAANDSFLKHVNDVKIACKDDDEILSLCSQPDNTRKILSSPTRNVDRRYRKLGTSKYWKTAPKLKDNEPTNAGSESKQVYHYKRPRYEIDRSQRNTPFKKRRWFDRSSIVTCEEGISCESVSNSPEKIRNSNDNTLAGKLREENGKLASIFQSQNSFDSRNSHVRLSIKSFKVPELFVEVPESTTVGSLKRTVLEAVTSILGGGLRVGVALQGKKIRDDNRTLLQAGISQDDVMDTVGFMLEPNSRRQPSPPISPKELQSPVFCDSQTVSPRSQLTPQKEKFLLGSLDKPSMTDSNSLAGSSRDLVLSDAMELPKQNVSDAKALVPVAETSMKALDILPINQRTKRSEIGKRRTRRPFSVSEVEALVHAVETLGTGRWRDVKIRSFDNATHRTYVDLKDKWKTLVHTARIAPQQRRGEPVPQELLDRVLAAQTYWSENQAKQHGKQTQHLPTR